ncbi:type I polyketide synthase [Trichlorobacter ammonificans]|uniref:Malonyl CoA-acyl carrier protein transacylase n=1 Tax=Trichlorobacter ammonificans TaxID=2916410 RepID=A0ABN8HML6_9BACT|nr:type I polyketide synthase [Trichlorobacter ammonificans]CAH2031277.1 Malonyl CoA-acyl carrier protein transacylase [Trichlorobacter ammonificans]
MTTDITRTAAAGSTVPLAIIGIGCLFPKADNVAAYWSLIENGTDAITEVPPSHWSLADYYDPDQKSPDRTYGNRGGFLSTLDFNPMEFNIPPNALEAIDTSQLLGLVAAGRALKDAGYGPGREYDKSRVSVILGVTGTLELVIPLGARLGHPVWRKALKEAGVDEAVAEDVVQRIADSYVPWQENSFPGLLGNVVAGRISKQYDLGGTNCVVDAACASSLSAVHLAALELASGTSDMVITGGVDTFNDIFMYTCFSKTPALSPTGNAKPFDGSADGTILGEGLGIVVLKRLADAERDGDRIYAVIKGIGTSSDGKGDAIYAPSSAGQQKALQDAYRQAGVTPDSIGLVEAHGTGTKAGDVVESSALRAVYGEADTPWCALGSVKSQIGHTKAAAGAAGLIKAALALHRRVLPPTIKVRTPLPEVTAQRSPFYLSTSKRPWLTRGTTPRRAAVSAFGFGGSNFHLVLEEYQNQVEQIAWDGTVQLFTFSAATPGKLDELLVSLPTEPTLDELRSHAKASRAAFKSNDPCRLAFVVEQGVNSLGAVTANARRLLVKSADSAWTSPDGICYATGPCPGPLAMLFPGQGSQYTGMLRDLACSFPALRETLTAADRDFIPANNHLLSDLIYPPSPFDAETAEQQETALRDTRVAQPAIGAVSLGAAKLLAGFECIPAVTAGHSYGELTALCVAGRMDEEALHLLSRLRGRLMAEGEGDKGSMLAVAAPLATVEQMLTEERLDLVIANRNAPSQAVLSGSSSEIERAAAACAARTLTAKRLPVAAAFHSSLVADAAQPFMSALHGIEFSTPRLPVYANSTAGEYPSDPIAAKTLLANQLARPVEFVAQIEAMYAAGVRTFLEVGPGARLTGLVSAILGERPHVALALDASSGKRSGVADLARCLARLASLGYPVRIAAWDESYQPPEAPARKPALTVGINGANYVKPRPKRPPVERPAVAQVTIEHQGQNMQKPQTQATTISAQPASRDALAESLRVTREGMAVLQKMQEETAQLHRRFLEGQEAATRTIQTLLAQQQLIAQGGSPAALVPATLPLPVAAPPQPSPASSLSPVVAAPVPSAPVAAAAVPAPVVPATPVVDTLLAVVAEKTGYPVEMLELEMGMDSDLGIDSIKRVEILSALQERLPGSPVIGPEHLGTLRTLGDIAAYLGAGTAAPVAAPAGAAPASPASSAPVVDTLLAVVAEKTGYPVEMLELEMGMDSDLGIDSIKRVEILSALQERLPGSPVIGPEHLGTLRTLGDIAAYLGAGTAAPVAAPAGAAPASPASSAPVVATLLAVVAEKTGYPVEMLELEMGMDSDLGIDSIKRVEILSALQERLPGSPVIGPEHLGTLRTLGDIAAYLGAGSAPVAAVPAVPEAAGMQEIPPPAEEPPQVVERSAIRPLMLPADSNQLTIARDGEIWVTNDASPLSEKLCALLRISGHTVRLVDPSEAEPDTSRADIAGLVLVAPATGCDDRFLENAFWLLRSAAPSLRRAAGAGGALFATVSRLDGFFGCGAETTLADPLSGGLAGLAKTASREWPDVICKAIDLGGFTDPAAAAGAVAAELFRSGPVEVGLTPQQRSGLELADLPEPVAAVTSPVQPGDVVVVTGGGRGVTTAAVVALAGAFKPLLVLLGRSSELLPEPEWLQGLTEESRIKRGILEHAAGKLHPRDIEEQYRTIVAGRELRHTLARVEAAGGRAIYRSVDIRDTGAVATLLESIRSEFGPIRGIVHGAGVLADRLIVDKTREQFNLVYATKVAGLRALLEATTGDDLRFIALFGSTTGRFGRKGQVDYAVANEVLNKLAQAESRRRPGCRVISFNWGPWDGGMVTPSLKKVFADEGIGLISLTAGGNLLIREIAACGGPVEVVALAAAEGKARAAAAPVAAKPLTTAFTITLTSEEFPFLRSHVMDGRAVLPMAVTMEWLSQGALHGNPGLYFHGMNDLRICKGVTLEAGQRLSLQVRAGRAEKRDSLYLVPVELVSTPGGDERPLLHAKGEVVLAKQLPEGIRSLPDPPLAPYAPLNNRIYDPHRLFHGPDLQGILEVSSCSPKGIAARVAAAPAPSRWIRQPLRSSWLTDPLALDCAFQLMILWSFHRFGAASLPCFAGRYRQYGESFPKDGVQTVIRVTAEREHGATADIEFLERSSGKLVARLEGYECVIDPSLERAFLRNSLGEDASDETTGHRAA